MHQDKSIYAAILVEFVFAALIPLAIMGYYFEDIYGNKINKSFFASIDWAICTVILYGLSIAKILTRLNNKQDINVVNIVIILLVFLIGASIANISSMSKPVMNKIGFGEYFFVPALIYMYANFLLSCGMFFIIAGWAELKIRK